MLKLEPLFEITSDNDLRKYFVQSYEVLLGRIFAECSKAAGRRIDSTCVILDLKGGSMKLMKPKVKKFIELASKIAQDNYPEVLGK